MPANYCSSAETPIPPSRPGHPSPLLSFLLALSSASLALAIASCASSQERDSIAIVQVAYDRLAQGDVDGYLAYCADEAVFIEQQNEPMGRDAFREALAYAVAQDARYVVRDLTANGNVVTYTIEEFFRDTSHATYSNAVAVVIDDKIMFWSPYEGLLLAECERNPSQAFCTGD